jgi:hypothetical protein
MTDTPIDISSRLPKKRARDAYAGQIERAAAVQERIWNALMDLGDLRGELGAASGTCSTDDFWAVVVHLKKAVNDAEVLLECAVDKLRNVTSERDASVTFLD